MLEGEEVKNKFAAAFGSYGWSGEAIMHIENYLDKIGFNVINQKYLIGSAVLIYRYSLCALSLPARKAWNLLRRQAEFLENKY